MRSGIGSKDVSAGEDPALRAIPLGAERATRRLKGRIAGWNSGSLVGESRWEVDSDVGQIDQLK